MFRVLVFPPFASYSRLLIHKVVETNFPDLITFSVGAQNHRRTVVAFVEACRRGEKGIQLLSQPKESRAKPSNTSSKWHNLSSQERVANWVRLREIKNRKREIWNSPKLFNVSDLERDDVDLSVESLHGEDVMERAKPKKQAAAVYVPPFLRARKGTDELQENLNNCQSSHIMEGLSPSISEQSSTDVQTQDEPKRPRGRGRGRRKPEIQVYVPKALRESKQETGREMQESSLNPQEMKGSNLNDAKDPVSGDEEIKSIFDDHEEQETDDYVLHGSNKVGEVAAAADLCNTQQVHDGSFTEDSLNLSAAAIPHSENTNSSIQHALSIDCSEIKDDQIGDNNLTFEFYDPAVIAFMPSPKIAQGEDHRIFSADVCNPVHSDSQSSELQHTCSKDSDSKSVDEKVPDCSSDQFVDAPNVMIPMEVDVNERTDETKVSQDDSEEPKQNILENIPCLDNISENAKDFTEKVSYDAVSSKKKSKPETKKKKKKKREEKNDSATSEQTVVKEQKSKSKTKSHKSPPEEEAKERSPADKQPQLQDEDGGNNGDSWDALFDDDGDCLDESVLDDITAHVGKVEIEKPKIDYLNYIPKEPDVNYEVYNHIVEIYDFPSEFGSHDIIGAFKDFLSQGFDIKWVDDTHALGVFSSAIAAKDALKVFHPMLKTRPMCAASRQGLNKAKSCQEFLQPYKERPQTTSMAARRLVAGALGVAPRMSKEMREQERNKLKAAKEKRKQEKQQRVDIWDGNFGKCAMDDV